MHGPIEFVNIFFQTFQSDFIDFYVNEKKTLQKKKLFSPFSSCFDMPRISQNLRERAIGMLYVGMTMNAVLMNIGCSTHAIRHLRQRFKRQGIRKIDYVMDVRASRRVAKTAIFG